jgi:hypothetical protein
MTNTEVVPGVEVLDIRTARISTAPSLSELSQLEYHLGYLASSKDRIYIRLWKNSGNGKFNTDWLALADIEKALSKIPTEGTFAADAFAPLFQGRSVNTRYFTIACLLHAGLLCRTEDGYIRNAPPELWQELQAAIDGSANLLPASMVHSAGHIVVPVFKTTKSGKKAGRPVGSGANA